MFKAFKSI